MARRSVTLLAVACIAVLVGMNPQTVVQVDVWAKEPIDLHEIRLDRAPLKNVLSQLQSSRPRAMPGSAHAAVSPTETVLSALSVRQVAADRIRIRLAVDEAGKGHRVIDAVRQGYVSGGVDERLRLASTTNGGFWVALAKVAGVLAGLALLCETVSAARRRRRRPSAA